MSAHAKSKSAEDSTESFDRFISLLDRYADYAKSAGKTIYRSPEPEARALFAGLPADRASWLLDRLHNELTAIEQLVAHGEKLTSNSRMLWRFFQQTGFKPCTDLLEKITDGHVIEVYAPNHCHIWQSFNFFDWISMSLEKIYTETWYQCTVRDPKLERDFALIATKVLGGEFNTTVEPGVPWHWVQETESARLYKFEFLMRYMSPIFLNGKVVGLVTVNECKNLLSNLTTK
jgi:hypothetical protein